MSNPKFRGIAELSTSVVLTILLAATAAGLLGVGATWAYNEMQKADHMKMQALIQGQAVLDGDIFAAQFNQPVVVEQIGYGWYDGRTGQEVGVQFRDVGASGKHFSWRLDRADYNLTYVIVKDPNSGVKKIFRWRFIRLSPETQAAMAAQFSDVFARQYASQYAQQYAQQYAGQYAQQIQQQLQDYVNQVIQQQLGSGVNINGGSSNTNTGGGSNSATGGSGATINGNSGSGSGSNSGGGSNAGAGGSGGGGNGGGGGGGGGGATSPPTTTQPPTTTTWPPPTTTQPPTTTATTTRTTPPPTTWPPPTTTQPPPPPTTDQSPTTTTCTITVVCDVRSDGAEICTQNGPGIPGVCEVTTIYHTATTTRSVTTTTPLQFTTSGVKPEPHPIPPDTGAGGGGGSGNSDDNDSPQWDWVIHPLGPEKPGTTTVMRGDVYEGKPHNNLDNVPTTVTTTTDGNQIIVTKTYGNGDVKDSYSGSSSSSSSSGSSGSSSSSSSSSDNNTTPPSVAPGVQVGKYKGNFSE